MLGLRFCARAFSSCGKRGPLFITVRGPLTIAASLVAEHRLQTRRLSSCGSRAQLLRGTWDLPRPRLEPVSPALAGRFSTTEPPGKPPNINFNILNFTVFFLFYLFIYLLLGYYKVVLVSTVQKSEVEFPVLYSRFSLVIYFINISIYMLVPISQFTLLSLSPPWKVNFTSTAQFDLPLHCTTY